MEDFPEMLGSNKKAKAKKIKPGSFQGLGISQPTYKAIMKMGYNMPTPIQRKTIPTILDGQDVVAMARTGSGKTAAFLIPVVERLQAHSVAVGFRAVALSPTRELAMQTAKFFRQLARFSDLRCCLLVGGQAMEAQFEHLANNPDVVVATPGRLMHHILEAELSLSRVEQLVIDEADRLFELGFAEQLQKILEACPLSRQCMLFSATLPSQLVSFSRVGLKDPVFVRLDVETTLSESLDLWYLFVRRDEKIAAAVSVLRFLAKPKTSTIMFVATKHHVEFFGELLNKIGISAAVVYGSMDQDARTEHVARFRRKKVSVLVTTDVAARGIDVPLLDYVVNYDFPPSGKLFVHRAGRTARAGRSGLAISLVTLDDLPYTVELMLFLGRKLAVADGGSSEEVAKAAGGSMPLLGALPSLDQDVEVLSALLQDHGSELSAFQKSMIASYKLYNKTRPSASKQSVARAKQLLQDCGGPAQLQRLIHPAFRETEFHAPTFKAEVASAKDETDLLRSLRGFRPKAAKIGNVLSTQAMRTMEAAKLDAGAVLSALKTAAGDRDSTDILVGTAPRLAAAQAAHREAAAAAACEAEAEAEASAAAGGFARRGRKRKAAEALAEARARPRPREQPRVSKRARQKQGKSGTGSGSQGLDELGGDDFDVSIDGVRVGGGDDQKAEPAKKSSQSVPTEQFYLSVERDKTEEAKERGLEMEQYQMDLMPDDSSDIKKAKSVIRWDAKKKKYLPVMVAVDGRALKGQRRNESGRKVKGDGEKSNIYKKWAQNTKKRIQKVGEMEQAYSHPLSRQAQQLAAKEAAKTSVEFDDSGEAKTDGQTDRKRKPVVPFHGDIDPKYLTHKQKRMINRRAKNDTVSADGGKFAPKELRTALQILQEKKTREKNKVKQSPHLRKQKAQQAKDARTKMHQERQMKSGRTKAKMLIFEGPGGPRKKKTSCGNGYGRGIR